LIDIAKDKAPGTVAYFQFLKALSDGFDNTSVPPTVADAATGGDTGGANASDLPTDCEGAKAYIEGLMAEHDTMFDLPTSDLVDVGQVTKVLYDNCPATDQFFARDDVTKFMGG
jgi:hypothetical protein